MNRQGYQPQNPQGGQQPYSTQRSAYSRNGDSQAVQYGYQQGYAPPMEQPIQTTKQGRGSGRAPKRKQKKKKPSWKWQLAKVFILLVLLGGIGVGGYVFKTRSDIKPYLNVFLSNVSVDGIDLSGKTWDEGSALVWAQLNAKRDSWYVSLTTQNGESKRITADTLGISYDPSAALSQAWSVGRGVNTSKNGSLNIFAFQKELERAKNTQNAFYSAEQSADTSVIDQILQILENAAYRAPQSAQFLGFNPDDEEHPFSFQNEVYGQRLNTMSLRERILSMVQKLESGDVLLETEVLTPSVTVEQLQQSVALRYRATTPIDSSSSETRTNNVRVACSKLNGKTLAAGAKLSFNNVVGRRTLENGFDYAIEYAYGEERMGIGGGTCQVSTTMYLAAVQAGMTITSRSPHSNPVSYTELGKDATVSDTKGREVDLVFRNNSGGTIYIAAHVIQRGSSKNGLMCEVRVYGPSLGGTRYVLESQTLETLAKPVEPTLREDTEQQYVVYTDERKRTYKGHDGYVVETYLSTYENENQTNRVLMYTDTYPARADVYYVGTVVK